MSTPSGCPTRKGASPDLASTSAGGQGSANWTDTTSLPLVPNAWTRFLSRNWLDGRGLFSTTITEYVVEEESDASSVHAVTSPVRSCVLKLASRCRWWCSSLDVGFDEGSLSLLKVERESAGAQPSDRSRKPPSQSTHKMHRQPLSMVLIVSNTASFPRNAHDAACRRTERRMTEGLEVRARTRCTTGGVSAARRTTV